MRKAILIFGLLALSGASLAAAQDCSLSFTNMNFGTYTGTLLNGTATGTVRCVGLWDIPLDAGTGAGATETIRKMTGPNGAELSYQVFQNAARTVNWGNTTTTEVTGSGNATVTAYGQILAGQNVAPGTYTDTLSTATTTFTVTAVIQANCTIAANALAFGNYAGALVKAASSLSVVCSAGTQYNIGLNAGTAAGATVTHRSMTGPGSALLGYQLFRDSARTANWGNTVGTDSLAGTGTGAVQAISVYGQIPAGQAPAPGSYADTITATITY